MSLLQIASHTLALTTHTPVSRALYVCSTNLECTRTQTLASDWLVVDPTFALHKVTTAVEGIQHWKCLGAYLGVPLTWCESKESNVSSLLFVMRHGKLLLAISITDKNLQH